jgi:hypothetical protein
MRRALKTGVALRSGPIGDFRCGRQIFGTDRRTLQHYKMQPAACNMQCAACSVQLATCSRQHVACSMQHAHAADAARCGGRRDLATVSVATACQSTAGDQSLRAVGSAADRRHRRRRLRHARPAGGITLCVPMLATLRVACARLYVACARFVRGMCSFVRGMCSFILCMCSFVRGMCSFILCMCSFVRGMCSFILCMCSFILCMCSFVRCMCTFVRCMLRLAWRSLHAARFLLEAARVNRKLCPPHAMHRDTRGGRTRGTGCAKAIRSAPFL